MHTLRGYGIGTLLGMAIERLIFIGYLIVRLITPGDTQPLVAELANMGYGIARLEVPKVLPPQ
ncbi:MAG: hypothetical protein LUP97_01735 [Methanoregula sp.]|nr:hypothetical protein [Methanoregula sp.]